LQLCRCLLSGLAQFVQRDHTAVFTAAGNPLCQQGRDRHRPPWSGEQPQDLLRLVLPAPVFQNVLLQCRKESAFLRLLRQAIPAQFGPLARQEYKLRPLPLIEGCFQFRAPPAVTDNSLIVHAGFCPDGLGKGCLFLPGHRLILLPVRKMAAVFHSVSSCLRPGDQSSSFSKPVKSIFLC